MLSIVNVQNRILMHRKILILQIFSSFPNEYYKYNYFSRFLLTILPIFYPKLANFGLTELGITANIFCYVTNSHCAKVYSNISTNIDTTHIFEFLLISEQNLNILPQNGKF